MLAPGCRGERDKCGRAPLREKSRLTAAREAPCGGACEIGRETLDGLLLGVLGDEGLDDVEDLFLLAAGQLADGFKELAGAAERGGRALGRAFA